MLLLLLLLNNNNNNLCQMIKILKRVPHPHKQTSHLQRIKNANF